MNKCYKSLIFIGFSNWWLTIGFLHLKIIQNASLNNIHDLEFNFKFDALFHISLKLAKGMFVLVYTSIPWFTEDSFRMNTSGICLLMQQLQKKRSDWLILKIWMACLQGFLFKSLLTNCLYVDLALPFPYYFPINSLLSINTDPFKR